MKEEQGVSGKLPILWVIVLQGLEGILVIDTNDNLGFWYIRCMKKEKTFLDSMEFCIKYFAFCTYVAEA
jgi:hypothetical protein